MSCILIFVAAKYKADRIARMLQNNNISADAIHGNKSQYQRTRALKDFKNGKVRVLVATDIAARGIDIDNISHVINYDLPNEPENYIHRIGRTARAGSSGTAYSFCAAEDRNYLNQIERKTKVRTPHADHKFHSLYAKNAKGAAAKPKPRAIRPSRGRSGGRGGGRSGGRNEKRSFSKGPARRESGGGSYSSEGFRRSRPQISGRMKPASRGPRDGNPRRSDSSDSRNRRGGRPGSRSGGHSRGGKSGGRSYNKTRASGSKRVRMGRTSR